MCYTRLISCLLASMWAAHIALAIPPSERPNSVYHAPLEESPVSLDPAVYADVYSIAVGNQLYDGLVRFDTYLKPVPALAKRWIIDRSGTVYTFQLRKEIRFHDGTPMTAAAVVNSFHRLLTPNSPVSSQLLTIKGAQAYLDGKTDRIEGVTATTEHLLRIELTHPYAPFLSILAMPNMVVVAPTSDNGTSFTPIGTGPFMFSSWQPNTRISLQKNPNYYLQAPTLDGVEFIIYENESTDAIYNDFKSGNLDHAILMRKLNAPLQGRTAADQRPINLLSRPGLNLIYLGFNQRNSVYANKDVRKAISYALNTERAVSETLASSATPAQSLIPPGLAGHDPTYSGYGYDAAAAISHFAAAGYTNLADFPPIQLWTSSKRPQIQRQLKLYQEQLLEIGINSELHIADNWKDYIAAIKSGKADLYFMGWFVDYADSDNILTPLVHSESVTNRTLYASEAVDAAIEEARRTVDYDRRVKIYRDLNRIVMDDIPLIPLYHKSFLCAVQPWVNGLEMTRLGDSHLRFNSVTLDASKGLKSVAAVTP